GKETKPGPYGRTEKEKAHDAEVYASKFLTAHELGTIAVLCDLILPATATAGSATDAGVPEFVDFIVKDITSHQLPIRGGLMWLDHQSRLRFDSVFMMGSMDNQKKLLDEIAYPDDVAPELAQGAEFFSRMRNLVLTGYYTTRMGIDDLGYQGNVANVWDGVPDDVLAKHGMSYEKEWLEKCVDQEKRNVLAQWDEEGRLVS
ncbi:MAG: gluconate 2-dehydrogenase subunit 3 family protein, partial [Saprospiraceae bacterium]